MIDFESVINNAVEMASKHAINDPDWDYNTFFYA